MSEEATIREDVSIDGEETVEAVEETAQTPEEEMKPLSQRDEVVQKIREKRDQEIKADMGVTEEVTEEEPEEPEVEEPEGELEEPEEEPEEPKEELVTIKVDGVEQQIPKDKIVEMGIRTAQKESAADYRLKQLALKQKELDQREAQVREMLAKHQEEAPKQEVSQRKQEFAKALIEDEDKAAEMYADSLERVARLEAKFNELAESTRANSDFVQEQRTTSAMSLANLFKREFPHLARTRELVMLANEETKRIQYENPDMSKEEVIIQAGKAVEADLRSRLGFEEHTEETEADPARATKRKMPQPIKKVSGKRPPKEEPKTPTASDIIREMARKRSPYA